MAGLTLAYIVIHVMRGYVKLNLEVNGKPNTMTFTKEDGTSEKADFIKVKFDSQKNINVKALILSLAYIREFFNRTHNKSVDWKLFIVGKAKDDIVNKLLQEDVELGNRFIESQIALKNAGVLVELIDNPAK